MSLRIAILLFTFFSFSVYAQQKPDASQTFTQEGVSVDFSVESAKGRVMAGTEATVQFKIVDTNSGRALSSRRPTAWIDRRAPGQMTDARQCREKIQSFLQPGFNRRPELDLNAYFILTLNREPNISVIDPLSGFGGSKLYTLVPLSSPGEDWVMTADNKRLYVSMPAANAFAVVDIPTWKVIDT